MAKGGSPSYEAKALLPLLKLPTESVTSILQLISVSPKDAIALREREAHAEQILAFRRRTSAFFLWQLGLAPRPAPEARAPVEKKPRSLPKFDRAAIVEALRSGERPKDVAKRLGCCAGHVRNVARFSGLRLRLGGPRKLSPDQQHAALARLESGGSWRRVSREFGISTTTLARYLRHKRTANG